MITEHIFLGALGDSRGKQEHWQSSEIQDDLKQCVISHVQEPVAAKDLS
jgi:hypothetical protein